MQEKQQAGWVSCLIQMRRVSGQITLVGMLTVPNKAVFILEHSSALMAMLSLLRRNFFSILPVSTPAIS